MSNEIEFVKGVNKLHAFYTEHVRMLAHAYDLSDEQAARVLDDYGYHNVARSILYPPRVQQIPDGMDDDSGL
ncbi:hypothetical protein GA0111570_10896 [Raineyella antarctica]|uniref:Uncharacterized protein n=1 Tax=Raineyella antarctica TaxID=1577474 RepID=A0A1G6HE03_9ACTN|nr:hypothetical protein [Raineyella antarctica]SDB91656.1 hypothetical protein GA0111570_10896 [Raineyella antarctica]